MATRNLRVKEWILLIVVVQLAKVDIQIAIIGDHRAAVQRIDVLICVANIRIFDKTLQTVFDKLGRKGVGHRSSK